MSGYIGNVPTPQATQSRDSFTATAGQTSFATSGYSAGGQFLDVHLNGVKLQDTEDYTATNGSDVVLTVGAGAGDTLEVVSFSTFEVADVYTRSETYSKVEADAEFVSDPNSSITVDGSGNVGIGTAPAASLDVGGNIHARGVSYPAFKFANSSGAALAEIYYGVGSADLNVVSNQAGGSIRLQAAGAERMRIDSSGRVTTPYQPAFHAIYANGYGQTLSGSTRFALHGRALVNAGNAYNASTGYFTAPVSGTYQLSIGMGANQVIHSAGYIVAELEINGSTNSSGLYSSSSDVTNQMEGGLTSGPWLVYLNAGDYVRPYYYCNMSYATGGSSVTGWQQARNYFSGYLIG